MKLAQKTEVIAELTEKIARAKSVTFCEFMGLTVAEVNQLRRACYKAGLEYIVAKNTLIHRSLPDDLKPKIKGYLKSSTAVALDYSDGVVGPKTIAQFAKDHPKLQMKAGILENDALNAAQMDALAKLPGREELYAKMLGSIQAPAQNILGCVNGVATKLAGLMKSYQEKLEKEAA